MIKISSLDKIVKKKKKFQWLNWFPAIPDCNKEVGCWDNTNCCPPHCNYTPHPDVKQKCTRRFCYAKAEATVRRKSSPQFLENLVATVRSFQVKQHLLRLNKDFYSIFYLPITVVAKEKMILC